MSGDRPRKTKKTARDRWKSLALATNASKKLLNALPSKRVGVTSPSVKAEVKAKNQETSAKGLDLASVFIAKTSNLTQKKKFASLVKKTTITNNDVTPKHDATPKPTTNNSSKSTAVSFISSNDTRPQQNGTQKVTTCSYKSYKLLRML